MSIGIDEASNTYFDFVRTYLIFLIIYTYMYIQSLTISRFINAYRYEDHQQPIPTYVHYYIRLTFSRGFEEVAYSITGAPFSPREVIGSQGL